MRNKNHIHISIDAQRAFDRTQHPFLIKTLSKVGTEGSFLNIIAVFFEKPIENITLNRKKLNLFPLRIRIRKGWPLSPLLFKIVLKVLAIGIRQEEEIKGIQIGKEVKLSLFMMTQYFTKKTLKTPSKLVDLINEFGNVAGYKINSQKSIAFLYTN